MQSWFKKKIFLSPCSKFVQSQYSFRGGGWCCWSICQANCFLALVSWRKDEYQRYIDLQVNKHTSQNAILSNQIYKVSHRVNAHSNTNITINIKFLLKVLAFQFMSDLFSIHPFTCCRPVSDFPMHGGFCQHSNNSLGWSAQLSWSLQHVLWLLELWTEPGTILKRFRYLFNIHTQVRTLCSRPESKTAQ